MMVMFFFFEYLCSDFCDEIVGVVFEIVEVCIEYVEVVIDVVDFGCDGFGIFVDCGDCG